MDIEVDRVFQAVGQTIKSRTGIPACLDCAWKREGRIFHVSLICHSCRRCSMADAK